MVQEVLLEAVYLCLLESLQLQIQEDLCSQIQDQAQQLALDAYVRGATLSFFCFLAVILLVSHRVRSLFFVSLEVLDKTWTRAASTRKWAPSTRYMRGTGLK